MLLQRLSKLGQQIAVDFPDMDCNGDKEFLKIASKISHRFESGVETSVLSWPVEGKVPIKSANIDTHGSESSNATWAKISQTAQQRPDSDCKGVSSSLYIGYH